MVVIESTLCHLHVIQEKACFLATHCSTNIISGIYEIGRWRNGTKDILTLLEHDLYKAENTKSNEGGIVPSHNVYYYLSKNQLVIIIIIIHSEGHVIYSEVYDKIY